MIRPHAEWILPPPLDAAPSLTGVSPAVATLLARRGIRTDAELASFRNPGPADLPPLELMTDALKAVDRIEAAVARRETVAIWGDYDADGTTAVAIWIHALRALGAEAIPYIPSRLDEGYGLSASGLDSLADRGVRLVVTCDCGVANRVEVAHAAARGMDVVVTDHHVPPPELPDAVAVVDPHRTDCIYPNSDLTGAGLAYRLATALLERRGAEAPDLAALAAIGMIADVAPMLGECRAIVTMGLAELGRTTHPGLRGLLEQASEHPRQPTARDVGFGVVPRLNAAGRLADAELALDLLITTDPVHAAHLLKALEAIHLERRALTALALDAARAQVASREVADREGTGPIVLRDDSWQPGLLGLVAGRLTDELARPVVAATRLDAEVRGSVRAPADFDVTVGLAACAAHLAKRGGHAAAGGFSTPLATWDAFAEAFASLPRPLPADRAPAPVRAGQLAVDLVLGARHLTWDLLTELDDLAPYGPGHAEPLLAVTGLLVGDSRRVGADAGHVSFRLRRGFETIDAIAFGTPAERDLPAVGAALDVVGHLERRTLDGEARLQLRVLDFATTDASPIAARRAAPVPAEA